MSKAICVKCGLPLGTGQVKFQRVDNKNHVVHRQCPEKSIDSKEDNNMASKKTSKKKATTKKTVKKINQKKAAPAPAPKTKKEKGKTISALVKKMLNEKKEYNEIEKAVKTEFPESKFNKAHYYWYKANM